MDPARHGLLPSNSSDTNVLEEDRGHKHAARLAGRQPARLLPAFEGWDRQAPGGSKETPRRLPARSRAGCRRHARLGSGTLVAIVTFTAPAWMIPQGMEI